MYQSHMIIILMVYITSMLVLISRQKHLLMVLLALETTMLSAVMLIPLITLSANVNMNILSIIMLSMGACEASLGLSLMVSMSRMFGTDLMKTLTMSKC